MYISSSPSLKKIFLSIFLIGCITQMHGTFKSSVTKTTLDLIKKHPRKIITVTGFTTLTLVIYKNLNPKIEKIPMKHMQDGYEKKCYESANKINYILRRRVSSSGGDGN